ncbi:MAG: uroporphyrinogen decarboxylase family protein [Phycisphaeraceae bacterium]
MNTLVNESLDLAHRLVEEMHAHGGLAPLDLERFWADDAKAKADPFAADCPQAACGVWMTGEAVWDELGIPEDWHRYAHDPAWRVELNRAYNGKAEPIVGKRMLPETFTPADHQYPHVKELYEIFEAKQEWHDWSYWILASAHDENELAALLDRVQKRLENLRQFILPDNWEAERVRLTKLGIKAPLYRGQRGPVTFATSIYGAENLLYLMMDNPALAQRFSDVIQAAMLGRARILDEEAGFTPDTAPHGFSFADDNSALLTPDLYEMFGYPILKAIFARYSPDPTDRRYQHSDSAMGHLLPILGRLNMTGCNFGPTLSVSEIRRHMPRTVIQGQLAPFTFSRNEEENIVAEFLRDFEQARAEKGLWFATAGSINNGSRLTGLRLIMSTIQRYGRYDAE